MPALTSSLTKNILLLGIATNGECMCCDLQCEQIKGSLAHFDMEINMTNAREQIHVQKIVQSLWAFLMVVFAFINSYVAPYK